MKNKINKSLCLLLLTSYSMVVFAQEVPNQLTKKEISEVIESVSKLLNSKYVYPDKAKKISQLLNKNYSKGVYSKMTNELEFAEKIQQDMLSVVNDSHLLFEYYPERIAQLRMEQLETKDSAEFKARLLEMQRFNFGFETVKILEGNIGYLKLNNFYDTEFASETAVAAMNFLSNTDSIIIDLRQNGGGSWKMIQLISSYLFEPNPVHLSGFYWREEDKFTQNWTLPYVPGKRSPDTDVFILTSANTHSAAEEFSYNLKHLKRATIIGETTVGGAHPSEEQIVNDHFTLLLPNGFSTNPITNTNWEGRGVIPNKEVPAAEALGVAKLNALQNLSEKHADESGDLYRWYLVSEKSKLNPVKLSEATLQSYAGNYGPRTLLAEGDQIYYQREGGPKLLLNALEEDLFELAVDSSFRMKIIKQDGQVTALQGLFDNGFKDQHTRQSQAE